jgi:hypothetical protein
MTGTQTLRNTLFSYGDDSMINRFMQKRIIIMLLGLITAIALFGILNIGLNITKSNPTIGNTFGILYLVIPVVLLLIAIIKFNMTKNSRLLTYAISVLASAVVVVPVLCIIFIFVVVAVFGMPVPT